MDGFPTTVCRRERLPLSATRAGEPRRMMSQYEAQPAARRSETARLEGEFRPQMAKMHSFSVTGPGGLDCPAGLAAGTGRLARAAQATGLALPAGGRGREA